MLPVSVERLLDGEHHRAGKQAASVQTTEFGQVVLICLSVRPFTKEPINIKTSLAGTCHAFDFQEYAHRYLAQVQFLFKRRFDLRAILMRLSQVACDARPCPLPRRSCD